MRALFLALALSLAGLCSIAFAGQSGPTFGGSTYGQSIENLRPQAEDRSANAQFLLGVLYAYGMGTRQNFVVAAHWFGLAADQGHIKAVHELARLLENGLGVARDEHRAFELNVYAANE